MGGSVISVHSNVELASHTEPDAGKCEFFLPFTKTYKEDVVLKNQMDPLPKNSDSIFFFYYFNMGVETAE